ncbi:MAG: PIG-L deacetylase family protein [Candidatus Nanoarchaeia archaeon]
MSKDTILIICAHPDDEILGAGGTAARYAQEGKRVVSIIYSYGEGGNWWMKKGYTRELRMRESKKAADIVGIKDIIFLGLKDLSLKQEVERPEVQEQVEKIILKYKPVKIFTHSRDDVVYADHKAVHDSVINILKKIKYKKDVFAFNIWGKDVRVSKNPKLLVNIKDTFKLKIRALKEFKSQRLLVMWQLLPGIYIRAIKCGFEHKCRFAEKFVSINLDEEPTR